MLLGLVFLIHSFGLIKVQDLSGSIVDSGHSLLQGLPENRYYKYRLGKNENESNYTTIKIFTKLKFRKAPTDSRKLWSGGVVPFVISTKCGRKQKKMILEAMKRYKFQTCVRFTPRKNETTFIMITPGRRCGTLLGYKKESKLPVIKGCYKHGIIIHELMKVLDLSVVQNNHDGENNSKNLGKDVRPFQKNDSWKSKFAKVNQIFGCYIQKTNDSRDRISGRSPEVSAETNRSNRRKRNARMPNDSSMQVADLATKVTVDKNVTSADCITKITTVNNGTSTRRATDVTTDNVTSVDPAKKIVTDNNITTTDSATEVTSDNVTPVDPVEKIVTDNNITTTDSATEVTTDNNITTDSATEFTTDNNVTLVNRVTEVTIDNNITSTKAKTTVGNLLKCNKQTNKGCFDASHIMPHHKIEIISSVLPRTSIVDPSKLWSQPEIPYILAEDKYDSTQLGLIQKAFEEFDNKTCVKFIPRTTEGTYISMQPGNRCSSTIGKTEGGVTNLSLDEGCFRPGTIVHEMMHALGFIHEQNRPDRDRYVMVVWDNIEPAAQHNYRKNTQSEVTSFGQAYDYGSVMHYGMYDFAVNNDRPTLIPLENGVTIGQRDGFSKTDIIKINKLFKCSEEKKEKEREEKITETKPNVSVQDFARKFMDFVSKLFKSIYRTLHRVQVEITAKY